MERRILHGNIKPNDIAQALMAEFNRGNLHSQTVGQANKLAVQIATRMGSQSGGQTALTVSIQTVTDGIMVEIGQQAWLGVAASLGQTAISALRNPFSLLGRLDDLAAPALKGRPTKGRPTKTRPHAGPEGPAYVLRL